MFKLFAIIFINIFIFSGCLDQRNESVNILQTNKKINVSFKKSENKVFDISLKDKAQVLVLNFFTTSCGACKEEFGSLNSLKNEFKGKVKILGILGEKISKKYALDFISQYKISYDVILNANDVNLFSSAVGDVFGVPVTYIFDKNGKLINKFLGYVPHGTIKKAILKSL